MSYNIIRETFESATGRPFEEATGLEIINFTKAYNMQRQKQYRLDHPEYYKEMYQRRKDKIKEAYIAKQAIKNAEKARLKQEKLELTNQVLDKIADEKLANKVTKFAKDKAAVKFLLEMMNEVPAQVAAC